MPSEKQVLQHYQLLDSYQDIWVATHIKDSIESYIDLPFTQPNEWYDGLLHITTVIKDMLPTRVEEFQLF